MGGFVTAAVIGAAGSAYAADKAAGSAKKGRKFQWAQLEEEQRQYDQTRDDWQPWRDAGVKAIENLNDPGAFMKSPAYNFIRDEGMRDVESRYSVKGGGGNAMKALTNWNKNNAATEYWNWRGDQRGMAGLGTQGTAQTQAAGQNYLAGAGRARDNLSSLHLWQGVQDANAMNAGLSSLTYGLMGYAGRPRGNDTLTAVPDEPNRTPYFGRW